MTTPIRVAVLDDYQDAARPQLTSLKSPDFEISYLPQTLPSFAHPATTPANKALLIERLQPFNVILTMRERTPFPAPLLSSLPNLKLLLTTGTKNAAIDMAAAKERGVIVAGTTGRETKGASPSRPKRGPDSTTQHTVAMILGLARNLAEDDKVVKSGGWQTGMAVGLSGKTLGVVGLGRLGLSVAKIMYQSFGMKIIAWSTSLTQEAADEKARAAGLEVDTEGEGKTFEVVSKEELFRRADVVSVHYVLSDRSRGIVSAPELKLMKPSALLINTSRGPLIDEESLLEALDAGKIAGAALDVFELEPLPLNSRWRTTNWGRDDKAHVLLTPHMGYVEKEIIGAWYAECADNVLRWKDGKGLSCLLN